MQFIQSQKTIILLIIGGLLVAGLIVLNLMQYMAYTEAREVLESEKDHLDEAQQELNELQTLADQSDDKEAALEKMQKLMPNEPEESAIVKDIQQWADDSQVEFEAVRFGSRSEGEGYVQMPIDLSIEGQYSQIRQLIQQLTDADRAFRVDEISMSGGSDNPPVLNVSIRCSAFYAID